MRLVGRIIGFSCLIFSVIFCIFVIAETGARVYLDIKKRSLHVQAKGVLMNVYDSELGYRMMPNFKGKYNINSHGFRDQEFSMDKPARTFRIINIGDSVTFGLGVDLSDVYNKVLQENLNGKSDSEVQYEVLNMGVGGYNAQQEYLFLKNRGLDFQPDLVLLGFFYNDSDPDLKLDKYGLLAESLNNEELKDMSPRSLLKRYSTFANLVHRVLSQRFKKNLNVLPGYMNLRVKEKRWAVMKEYIKKMEVLCTSHGVKFVVVNFPSGYQMDFKEHQFLIQKDISSFCDEKGIFFLDLTPAFKMHKNEDLFVVDNQHPSKIGNEISAKEILGFLINKGLVPIAS